MRACRLCSIVVSLLLIQSATAGDLDKYVNGRPLADQTLPELIETLRGAVERYVEQTKVARAVVDMGGWQYARTHGHISRQSGHIRHLLDYLAHLDLTIEVARALQAQKASTARLPFDLADAYREAAAEHVQLKREISRRAPYEFLAKYDAKQREGELVPSDLSLLLSIQRG